MKNTLLFPVLFVFLFFTESFSQHEVNHLQCGTEHFPLKVKQIRSASTAQYFQYIKSAKTSPYVIRYGDSFTLEVRVTEPTVDGIQVQADHGGLSIEYQNQTPSFIQLYDDGSHGDAVPNDRLFTSDQLKINPASLEFVDKNLPASTFGRFFTVKYHFTNNSEVVLNEDLALTIRFVPVNFSVGVVNQAESTVQYSSHLVNIVYDNQGSSFMEQFNLGNMPDIQSIIKEKYYKYFPDNKDFLVFSTTFNTPGAPAGFFGSISRDFSNVIYNSGPFTTSSQWRSAGRLKGKIAMCYTSETNGILLNHEVFHYWGSFLNPLLPLDGGTAHWKLGVEFTDGGSGFAFGQHGSLITPLGNGQYLFNNAVNSNYNTLELYMMGMISFDAVTFPIRYLINPVFVSYTPNAASIYTADGIGQVSKNDFLAAMGGLRSPAYTETQKKFNLGMIVFSDRLLNPLEMAYFNNAARLHESKDTGPDATNFYAATNTKGEFSTRLFECVDNLVLQSPADDFNNPINKKAALSITASNKILNPAVVEYKAGKYVLLQPGFMADNGAVFKAYTQTAPCDN